MGTYLFTWKPSYWPGMYDLYERWRTGSDRVVQYWSSGNTKSIGPDERIFLMRLGDEPKGIVASGYTVRGWYTRRTVSEPGDMNANDLMFDAMVHPDSPLVPIERLEQINRNFRWTPQASGIEIPQDTAEKLEREWAKALADAGASPVTGDTPIVDDAPEGEPEGKAKYVRHRIRERSRRVVTMKRAAAMQQDGVLRCEACRVVPADLYGVDVIECHHIDWLSFTGERITRPDELALLCPTCHRAIHKLGFQSVAELRRAMSRQ